MSNSENDKKTPLLSLCIPTNGALQWIGPVIDSIYEQGCDEDLFEILVSDNAKNPELKTFVENYGHKNIYYQESDAKGFLNIVSSFSAAKGEFCKLINHRAKLKDGALKMLIDTVNNHKEKQPVIYFTNGAIGVEPKEIQCKNLDELVYNLHYFCTWMAGIGVWRKDIPNLKNIEYNKMFPNSSILFEQRTEESEYLLSNIVFFEEQNGSGKGCYNLFHTFAVVFPDMLTDLKNRGRITENTFKKVLKDLFGCLKEFYLNFVVVNRDESFDFTGIRKNLSVYYPWYAHYQILYYVYRRKSARTALFKRLMSKKKK
ncbi:MAG: hypothetical protein KBT34_11915 [Prevotella sp.]|nr:hypothetical protein [Candidatus Prevotella equi]